MINHTIYLGLGSNLGDRAANLRAAIASLPPAVEVLRASPIYETAPWGFKDQGNFLNQVVAGQSQLEPEKLLEYVKKLELQIGRTPTFRNGPREIDIDILFYDDLILETDELTIPHPRLAERAFILVPLADVAADFVHPVSGQTMAHYLAKLDSKDVNPFKELEN